MYTVCVVGLGEDTRGNFFESLGEMKMHFYAWHFIFSYYQLSTFHIMCIEDHLVM